MTDNIKELDLEECINQSHAQIRNIPECKECEGYNYNCPSYYPIKNIYKRKEREN